jgi:hypothetical protein
MRSKLVAASVGVAILALVAVGVASASPTATTHGKLGGWAADIPATARATDTAAAPDISKARRLHFIWHPTTFSFEDNPPAGDSNGDEFTFSGPLLNPQTKQPVGFLAGHCTIVDQAKAGLVECEVTAAPTSVKNLGAATQITMQGFGDNTPMPFRNAVTGGTGIYQNARGQAIGTALPSGDLDLVFHLIP